MFRNPVISFKPNQNNKISQLFSISVVFWSTHKRWQILFTSADILGALDSSIFSLYAVNNFAWLYSWAPADFNTQHQHFVPLQCCCCCWCDAPVARSAKLYRINKKPEIDIFVQNYVRLFSVRQSPKLLRNLQYSKQSKRRENWINQPKTGLFFRLFQ